MTKEEIAEVMPLKNVRRTFGGILDTLATGTINFFVDGVTGSKEGMLIPIKKISGPDLERYKIANPNKWQQLESTGSYKDKDKNHSIFYNN